MYFEIYTKNDNNTVNATADSIYLILSEYVLNIYTKSDNNTINTAADTGSPEQRGQRGCQPPQSSLLMCPFLLLSPLNSLFLKEVTNNVHENQQVKLQAS